MLRIDAADVEHTACKDEYPEVPFAISLLCWDTGEIEVLSIDDLALGDRSTICLQACPCGCERIANSVKGMESTAAAMP